MLPRRSPRCRPRPGKTTNNRQARRVAVAPPERMEQSRTGDQQVGRHVPGVGAEDRTEGQREKCEAGEECTTRGPYA